MFAKIFMSGAAVNFYLVIAGGLVGVLLKKGIPERIRKTLVFAIGLCVLYIGISGIFTDEKINAVIVVISMAVGAVIGEALDLDELVNKLALKIEMKFAKDAPENKTADGFVTATMVFCIGAMAVVGSIDSGIRGDNTTLYSKALIDCITASVFASTMGIGVAFSAIPVLVYEGGLTLLAGVVSPVLSSRMVAHISVVGSLLIIAIGLNMLKLTKIKIMNLLPAVFIPIGLCFIF